MTYPTPTRIREPVPTWEGLPTDAEENDICSVEELIPLGLVGIFHNGQWRHTQIFTTPSILAVQKIATRLHQGSSETNTLEDVLHALVGDNGRVREIVDGWIQHGVGNTAAGKLK